MVYGVWSMGIQKHKLQMLWIFFNINSLASNKLSLFISLLRQVYMRMNKCVILNEFFIRNNVCILIHLLYTANLAPSILSLSRSLQFTITL